MECLPSVLPKTTADVVAQGGCREWVALGVLRS
jgi:hypothetical protein